MWGILEEIPRAGLGPWYLDEAEGRSGGQDDVLVAELVLHVLFQALLLVDFPAVHHVKQSPGRHRDGEGLLGFGLQTEVPVAGAATQMGRGQE